jgi:aldehyde:ferredoxin oxidoreductase
MKREELLDTCLSSNSTFEVGMAIDPAELGVPARIDLYNPVELPESMAKIYGRRYVEDSIGVCTFTAVVSLTTLFDVVNAITGWDYTLPEILASGRRIGNLLRAFNVRCGIGPETELPSPRYGGVPVDGPAQGVGASAVWDQMREIYYARQGWDPATGKPLPATLIAYGLPDVAAELWEAEGTPAGAAGRT